MSVVSCRFRGTITSPQGRMKPYVQLVILLFVAFFGVGANSAGPYIGSTKSNVYHVVSCRWAEKISPSNRVTFQSKEDAARAGYRPCKVCKP